MSNEIAKKRRADFRTVFETEAGEAVLRDLIQFSGVFTTVPPDVPNPEARAYTAEGRRDMLIYILSQLNRRIDSAEAMLDHSKPPYEPSFTENDRDE